MKYYKIWFYFSMVFFYACSQPLSGKPEDELKNNAIELLSSKDLDVLVEASANKKLVLLGEASHGTHEYYVWRDSISRRLISEKGFNFIAVEGDFAVLFELNRYVKNLPGAASSAHEVLRSIDRWPTWMWGNYEIVGLAEWLRKHNDNLLQGPKVGFYGIDVYDEWRSKAMLLEHLQRAVPTIYEKVKKQYDCFAPFVGQSWEYGAAVASGAVDCGPGAAMVVELIRNNEDMFKDDCIYDFFYAIQNAYVVRNAERFYRKSAMRRSDESWNSRVFHFYETTLRLLDFYGDGSKGLVWAHNTHIGDAGFTEMINFNQLNIGQLARDGLGSENVFLVGFTTYKGRVKAGRQWGLPGEVMQVAPAQPNSLEEVLSRVGKDAFYLLFDDQLAQNELLSGVLGNRAIGVVFDPRNEPRQYVRTIVPRRYDAMVFFKETRALSPLN